MLLWPQVRSQLQLYEHEGNWSKAAESYDLLLRSQESMLGMRVSTTEQHVSGQRDWQLHQGLMKSLQQMGCSLIANLYYTGLAQEGGIAKDSQFRELEYEAAWRAGKWDVNCFGPELTASGSSGGSSSSSSSSITSDRNAEYGFHSKLYRFVESSSLKKTQQCAANGKIGSACSVKILILMLVNPIAPLSGDIPSMFLAATHHFNSVLLSSCHRYDIHLQSL